MANSRYYQIYNPLTDRWSKVDRETNLIVSTKKSKGPYKGVPKR